MKSPLILFFALPLLAQLKVVGPSSMRSSNQHFVVLHLP
jgi:hypothetical protein